MYSLFLCGNLCGSLCVLCSYVVIYVVVYVFNDYLYLHMTSNTDISSRADLEWIAESFYTKAMHDDQIGYIFTDVAKLDLSLHIPKIVDFWESVLFGVAKYQGNPVRQHVLLNQLSPLRKEHFEQWLVLWNQTINSRFVGEKADEILSKAKMMGDLMLYKIAASEQHGFVQ